MSKKTFSALFDNELSAETAINHLKQVGIDESDISMIARHGGETVVTDVNGDEIEGTAMDITGGAAMGAGTGAILGVAALAIPGVGPFLAAGAITTSSTISGAATTGAVAGAITGGLAGALKDHGVDMADAEYYESELKLGRVLVLFEAQEDQMPNANYELILRDGGGQSSYWTSTG